jgi:RNA polymerase sigma-70 factor, ECF subfamily
MTGHTLPEPVLIGRARAGDTEAFRALVEIHSDQVYRALRGFAVDAEEAQEVAQEVFLRAWRGLTRFEGRAELSTWLCRIAFNESQRRLSRRAPEPARPGPDGGNLLDSVTDAPHSRPEAKTLEHELESVVWDALAKLPALWRAAVVLRDIECLSTDEAAAVIGVRPAALKSRLHRGRMQLRTLLEPYLEPVSPDP